MKNKQQRFEAIKGLFSAALAARMKEQAFTELFLLESGRHLLDELGDKRSLDGCVSRFDEFLLECGAPRSLAPALALEICTLAKKEGVSLPVFLPVEKKEPQDICYVKNRFTEQVFPLLSGKPGIYYAESFEEACAMTAEGKRQGCLLPFMGEERLPLSGIARLLDEYDLKKHRRFVIDNGEQNTVYLLLCSEIRQNARADLMEWMAAASGNELSALARAAEKCGLACSLPTPLRGLSEPQAQSDTVFCRFTLKGQPEDLLLFSGVIRLCLADSTPTGLYDTVELLEE